MEEYGNFNVSEKDMEDALNPGSKRHKMSKEEAIYGVWADEEDDRSASTSSKFINFKQEKSHKKATTTSRKGKISTKKDDFGSWEKHTTGFGSKILEKMGFQAGKGLGRDGSGIIEPVQAVARQGRASLGAYGSEKVDAPRKGLEPDPAPQINQSEYDIEKPSETPIKANKTWKKSQSTEQKYKYKTFDDLKKESERASTFFTDSDKIKIVDMTGAEAKISYGYDTLNIQPKSGSNSKVTRYFEAAELTHNIHLLLNLTEKYIKTHLKKIQIQKDVLVGLNHEKEGLCKTAVTIDEEMKKLSDFTETLEQLKSFMDHETNLVNRIEFFIHFYDIAHSKFYEECKEFNIEGVVGSILLPDLFKLSQTWDLINQPDLYFDLFKKWREIVKKCSSNSHPNQIISFTSPYELFDKTLNEIVGPRLVEVLSNYDLRNYHPVLIFLSTWKELMSDTIWKNFTKNIILRFLQIQVEKWDPLNDVYPIHIWVKCWIDILNNELEVIYNIIQRKFITALSDWHPSDLSPKIMLLPWVGVFKDNQMHMLLVKSILPKLMDCLSHELTINPRKQVLEPFMWVMQWKDIIPLQVMADLFHRAFFSNWLNVLYVWLQQNPNYDDVKKWYTGWKSMFDASLQSQLVIKNGFNHALVMIQQSMNGTPISSIEEYSVKCIQSSPATKQTTHKVTLTFKELIEQSATENSLTFTPLPKRTHDGKSIYQFGISQIYIDKGVIFVQSDSSTSQQWIPISLLQLVKISK